MTIIKNLTFPNSSISAYSEDPAEWDTEIIESMSGITFRNGRRTVAKRRFRLTVWGENRRDDIQAVIALKDQVEGRLYGFKFIPPSEVVAIPVAFTEDGWTFDLEPGADDESRPVTIEVELEEVIGGIAEEAEPS